MEKKCGPGDLMIRQANPGDIDEMIILLHNLFSIEADFVPNVAKNRKGLALLMEAPELAQIFVAKCKANLVGMATVQILVSTAEGGRVGLVEDVVVLEEYRGRGIGSELLEAVEDYAKQEGLLRLQLLADVENLPALKFYGNQGWNKTQLQAWRKYPNY